MVKLVKADIDDCSFVHSIRNEQSVRESSFNTDEIDYLDHSKWFRNSLRSTYTTIFIIYNNDVRVGYIRLDNLVEINIAINKSERNNGFALESLRQIDDLITCKKIAKVKTNNTNSINLFKKSGYNSENISHKHKLLIK